MSFCILFACYTCPMLTDRDYMRRDETGLIRAKPTLKLIVIRPKHYWFTRLIYLLSFLLSALVLFKAFK